MKVRLINVADYNINVEKCSSLPFDVFKKLVGYNEETNNSEYEDLPLYGICKSIEEFKSSPYAAIYDFDDTKPTYINNSNGQFFVGLKEKGSVYDATNTEEDKGTQA